MIPNRIHDWQLERFRLGELDEEGRAAVAHALERDESLRARLAALDESDARILADHPPARVAAAIRARAGERPAGRRPVVPRTALALAASGVLLVAIGTLVSRSPESPTGPPAADVTRIKGLRPYLVLYRRAPAGPEALRDGGVVRPGDTIQVEYVAAGSRYGVIVSQDGRGAVTVHLSAGDRAAALAGGPVPLGAAFELDDAPAFEEFYFVTSRQPFAVKVVTDALARAAASRSKDEATVLDLPPGLAVSTFLLRKDSSR